MPGTMIVAPEHDEPPLVWRVASAAASPIPVALTSLIMDRRRSVLGRDRLAVAIVLGCCVVLKPLIGKPRPQPTRFGDPWGLPSGHTAGVAALAGADPLHACLAGDTAFEVAARTMLAGLVTGIAGTARVRCRVHDKTDVAAGCALAALVNAALFSRAFRS